MNVSIDASANALPDPAIVCLQVPRPLVRMSSEFANQSLPSFLTYVGATNTADYVIPCYQIDRDEFFSHSEFTIGFTSNVLTTGQVAPEYTFTATIGDQSSSEVIQTSTATPTYPHFAKYRKFGVNAQGQGLLDLNYPYLNGYELVFNRNFSGTFTNVVVEDTPAPGTKVYADYPAMSYVPGDKVSVNGIRIYTIDNTITSGENREYVTDQFLDKIFYNEESGAFRVELGTVPANISYVIQYGVEVTDPSLGTYTNTAVLTRDNGSVAKTSTEVIKTNGAANGFFEKMVDETLINQRQQELTYTFSIGGPTYQLPAGTEFYDYLPEGVSFERIIDSADGLIALQSADGNKITFVTTGDINNTTEQFSFSVNVNDYDAVNNDLALKNIGYIKLGSGTFYSNTVSTQFLSQIEIRYVDTDGDEIMASDYSDGQINDPYTTAAKTIPGWTFLEVQGEESGVYTNDNIVVTYVYEKNDSNETSSNNSQSNTNTDALPITGQNTMFIMGVGITVISVAGAVLIRNKKNNDK